MNHFTGIGNVGADPILRETPSGRSVTNFSLAIDRRFYQGEGDDRRLCRETDWIPVVVWSTLATTCAKHLQKGSKVAVEGQVRPRTYTDKNNVNHSTFELVASTVHFLDRIRNSDQPNEEVVSEDDAESN